ncbi:MAG: adenylosuccinate lyase [Patescibacteria group bacterium]|nr:adenylosuccinate lyase [Patescibacteria group bacterium]
MNLKSIHALSPLDGRYSKRLSPIHQFFSEYALIRFRLQVEVEYLIAFLEKTKLQPLSATQKKSLRNIYLLFSEPAAQRVKELEEKCHHDVKAIEYYLQEELKKEKLDRLVPYIHIGLTSEDVNSCAYGLALTRVLKEVLIPRLSDLVAATATFAESSATAVMLARTHGQPAVPTTLGKEVVVFANRLEKVLVSLNDIAIEAKLGGAVGNWNALAFVMPKDNWMAFSQKFIAQLGLKPSLVSTQIVSAESYSECFQALVRLNVILIDFTRDMWQYISDSYVLQKVTEGQVGSSTMPQKVNPIDFENSEGNAGLAIALLQHFVEKLPISRLQRDLSDSTVKRSIGTAFGHTLLAVSSLQHGLEKVTSNTEYMKQIVDSHPEVLAEALQTALRLSGNEAAYEKMRDLTRGKSISKRDLDVVAQEITATDLRRSFLHLMPAEYVGLSKEIVKQEVVRIKKTLNTIRKG